ncbi:MAG TPA: hypothetical protein VFS67_29035 [Polyangiaceae bacterium]|jgi:hypothetical protein|nr:hypothetical protein [Polyangiaceae bacterium]
MAPPPTPPRRERLKRLFVEYGALAIAVHYTIYVLVLLGLALVMLQRTPAAPLTSAQTLGVLAAAYVANKLAMPLRALGTLALTPLLRALWRRRRKPAGCDLPPGPAS